MVHLVHPLISSRKATIRGQYDEIYVNDRVVNPWFIMFHLWFMTRGHGKTTLTERWKWTNGS